jgi:hypothetical protein
LGAGNSVIAPDVVIRPILFVEGSRNHIAPSDPIAMPDPPPPEEVGIGYSVIAPDVVIRPILSEVSMNQSAPSGPAVMPLDPAEVGKQNSVIAPAVVTRPILLSVFSVNHNAPSAPEVIVHGKAVAQQYPVTVPEVVIRPIPFAAANHSAPSGSEVIPAGGGEAVPIESRYSVKVCAPALADNPSNTTATAEPSEIANRRLSPFDIWPP